ncbi:hypothetical protein QQ045_020575 [Rhodiola kirilowii]
MEEDGSRRMSSRTRKVASKMTAALQSSDNRAQAALARLDALENDKDVLETVDVNDEMKKLHLARSRSAALARSSSLRNLWTIDSS